MSELVYTENLLIYNFCRDYGWKIKMNIQDNEEHHVTGKFKQGKFLTSFNFILNFANDHAKK